MKLKIFIILTSLFLFSCKEFKDIAVTNVEEFHVTKLNLEKIEAEIKLKINNPNSMGFSIYPSEFDITFSGMRLGKAKLHKRVHIGPKSERVYTFKLNKNLSDLNPLEILNLLNSNNLGKIEVKGKLKAGKFYIKKKFPINYIDKAELFR